ncbi:MAG: tyrosine-type recombinase/integrase [Brevundimonas sp.]|nr:tyrosine-type recombinase/integrase [Brevundimonas sp.]
MSGGRFGPDKAPERQCLPVAIWPEQDRLAWEAASTPTSILEDTGGELTHLAPISQRKTAKGWGRFLNHLRFNDPSALVEPVARRITLSRVRGYVRRLEELGNSSRTVLCRLQELVDAGRILAPDDAFGFIRHIASHVRGRHRPARPKTNRVMGDEVVTMACNHMEAAQAKSGTEGAVQFRDGLILLLLIHLPLRRKNFTALALGESLVFRQGQWFVTLTPAQTKTHAHFEAALHPNLVPWLETYLAQHRPILLACEGRWKTDPGERLWVSNHGSPMTEIAIYDRVARLTKSAFGESISPHRFRDMAASTIASHAPEYIHAAAPLLGHATLRTTEKYYRQARAQEGQKRYLSTLQDIRRKANG